jgi:hypothetical protein
MQREDAAEPVKWDIAELKRTIEEWDGIASHILQLLQETAHAAASQNWRPHATQIIAVVRRFRELCARELQQLGLWRKDGLTPDEAYEQVWHEADALVKWLGRMVQP